MIGPYPDSVPLRLPYCCRTVAVKGLLGRESRRLVAPARMPGAVVHIVRCYCLAPIVIPRAFPVRPGLLVVVAQRPRGDPMQIFGGQEHGRSFHAVDDVNG